MKDKATDIYNRVVAAFEQTGSVNQVIEKVGVSKLTTQKILITEGLWESERSREVLRLKDDGYTTEEIAEILHISIKGVQAYLPYTRKPYHSADTSDAIRSKRKRDKMKTATENQVNAAGGKAHSVPIVFEDLKVKSFSDKPEVKKGDKAKKPKVPSVLGLHLELVQDEDGTPLAFDADEEVLLGKFAKVKAGFSRDILVPTDMPLHALHYAIQRLFGWENEHLRSFSLMPKDFSKLTAGKVTAWEQLCGAYFKFPTEEDPEEFWDDDYEGEQSFKTWLKKKYKGPYYAYGVSDTYCRNQAQVDELNDWLRKKRFSPETLGELTRTIYIGGDYNILLERLKLSELLLPKTLRKPKIESVLSFAAESIEGVKNVFAEYNDDISDKYMNFVSNNCYRDMKTKSVVESFQSFRRQFEPALKPFTHDLMYQYDFGDGWCVKITCEEGYYYNDSFDTADGYLRIPNNETAFLLDREYYRCEDDRRVSDEMNELMRNVEWKQLPACIDADGLNLVDDVGGIYGYIDFIRTLHGDDKEEAQNMREWAENLGWSGRMTKPEKML